MTPIWCMCDTASTIVRHMSAAFFSEYFFSWMMRSNSSPPVHSSITMCTSFESSNVS